MERTMKGDVNFGWNKKEIVVINPGSYENKTNVLIFSVTGISYPGVSTSCAFINSLQWWKCARPTGSRAFFAGNRLHLNVNRVNIAHAHQCYATDGQLFLQRAPSSGRARCGVQNWSSCWVDRWSATIAALRHYGDPGWKREGLVYPFSVINNQVHI